MGYDPMRLLLEGEIAILRSQLDEVKRLVRQAVEQWEADVSRGLTLNVSIIMHSHMAALRQWLEGQR